LRHYCPACQGLHMFFTDHADPQTGARWEWDGQICVPTFSPEMHIVQRRVQNPKVIVSVCHYRLRNGMLKFLSDCTHHCKGVEMELPPLPEHYRDPTWYP
jgi:hypothetical protein